MVDIALTGAGPLDEVVEMVGGYCGFEQSRLGRSEKAFSFGGIAQPLRCLDKPGTISGGFPCTLYMSELMAKAYGVAERRHLRSGRLWRYT